MGTESQVVKEKVKENKQADKSDCRHRIRLVRRKEEKKSKERENIAVLYGNILVITQAHFPTKGRSCTVAQEFFFFLSLQSQGSLVVVGTGTETRRNAVFVVFLEG